MKHHPTPWKLTENLAEVLDANNGIVFYSADLENEEASMQDHINSEYIVKCVNSHDALVKALSAFMEFDMGCDTELLHGGDQRMQEAIVMAKQALKAAGGEV